MYTNYTTYIYYLIFSVCLVHQINATQALPNVSDIEKQLAETKDQEERVNLYNDLSYALKSISTNAMDSIANIALAYADDIDYIRGKAIAYKNIGIAKGKAGMPLDSVLRYNNMSLQFAVQAEDYYTIVAILNNNAVGYQYFSMYTTALENLHKAYEIHNKHLPEDRLKVLILNNIGSLYSKLNENKNANSFFKKGFDLAKKLNKPELILPNIDDFCVNLLNIGDTIQALKNIDEYSHIFSENNNNSGFLKLKLLQIKIHINRKEYDSALDGIDYIEQNKKFNQYKIEYCETIILKTQTYIALGKLDNINQLVENNTKCAENLQMYNLIIQAKKNELDLYFAKGNLRKAQELSKQYLLLIEQNTEKEKLFYQQDLNANFRDDRQKEEIQRLNLHAVQRESTVKFLIAATIFFSILALLATWFQNKYRNLNQSLKTKNNQIVSTQNELSSKNKELQKYIESNIQLEQFAHIAAHDLKSPLRVLSSFTGLLKKKTNKKLDLKEKEYFKFIEDSAKQMSLLVQDLLDYSKANSQVLAIAKIDLEPFIVEILSMFQITNSIDTDSITIADCKKIIYADPIKLKQVFQNILSNALKFTEDHQVAKIRIEALETDNHFNFSITDNGIGIPDDYKDIVFNSFTQLNPNKFDGSGIGLSICKKIIERHEGNISIADNHPQGTKIKFSISKSLEQRYQN